MKDHKIYSHEEIKKRIKTYNLMQLYVWLPENRLDWLKIEQTRIAGDNTRQAYIVKFGSRYSLYVNRVA